MQSLISLFFIGLFIYLMFFEKVEWVAVVAMATTKKTDSRKLTRITHLTKPREM